MHCYLAVLLLGKAQEDFARMLASYLFGGWWHGESSNEVLSCSLQRRYIFKPLVRQLWGATPAGNVKIDNFVQFAKQVGPG